eukprot:1159922-Pelagomonas_calceolata.AAC.1
MHPEAFFVATGRYTHTVSEPCLVACAGGSLFGTVPLHSLLPTIALATTNHVTCCTGNGNGIKHTTLACSRLSNGCEPDAQGLRCDCCGMPSASSPPAICRPETQMVSVPLGQSLSLKHAVKLVL